MPRIRATAAPASDEVDDTSSEGETWFSCRMSVAPVYSRVWAVTALTAIGTSDSASLRRVAVMTILLVSTGCCSRAWSCTAAASAVAPCVGCAALLSVSVFEVAVWANAGLATATRPAESSHADLRIISLSPSGLEPGRGARLMRMPAQRKRLRSGRGHNDLPLQQFGNSSVSKRTLRRSSRDSRSAGNGRSSPASAPCP